MAAVHTEDLCIISDIITPIAFNLSFKMQREILTKFHLNILRCACDCAQIFVRERWNGWKLEWIFCWSPQQSRAWHDVTVEHDERFKPCNNSARRRVPHFTRSVSCSDNRATTKRKLPSYCCRHATVALRWHLQRFRCVMSTSSFTKTTTTTRFRPKIYMFMGCREVCLEN